MLKRSVLLALAVIVLAACAPLNPTAGLTAVSVTDYKMVAGKWGGVVDGMSAKQDDWVDLTIAPDGKYSFDMSRGIGVFAASGMLTMRDGKVQMRGERGYATLTLYEGPEKRVLQAQGSLTDGRQVSGYLNPK